MRATRLAAAALAAAIAAPAAGWAAEDGFIRKESPHSVETTMNRLSGAIAEAGAKVFARIEHADGAALMGMELRPTTLLIFGNPQIGTPMMQSSQTMGIDLPLRVLAYEDAEGQVHVIYRDIETVAAGHGVEAETVSKAAGAMERLTDTAVATEE
jgi:uncharacterized protein (DUF302 family)